MLLVLTIGVLLWIVFLMDRVGTQVADANLRILPVARHTQVINGEIQSVWQWLTDISATRGLNGLDDGFSKAEISVLGLQKEAALLRALYEKNQNPAGVAEIDEILLRFKPFYQVGLAMARAYVENGPASGNKMMNRFDTVAEKLVEAASKLTDKADSQLFESMIRIENTVRLGKYGVLGLGFGLVILLGGLGYLLTRSINRDINAVVAGVTTASDQVNAAADQVASSSQALAQGASEQAANLEETSSTLQMVSEIIGQTSANTKQADALSNAVRADIQKSNDAILRMGTAINEIKTSSNETAKIIKSIDEIAFQTNLLALNAAVEAARAGDAGRGFAVVADEVGNLAQRSASAARTTTELIRRSQESTQVGVSVASEVETFLNNVKDSTEKVMGLVNNVATATEEQSRGIDQVNTAVSEISVVTQDVAASAEENASASEELSSQSEVLQGMMKNLARLAGISGKHHNVGNSSRQQPWPDEEARLLALEDRA